MTTTAKIHQLRLCYWSNGFRPVPINNGEKFPLQKAWTTLARLDPPNAVTEVPNPWQLGTGFLCDRLRVVDIDIDDDQEAIALLAEHCFEHIGPAPIRYRDNASRIVLLYRAPDGTSPRKASTKNKTTERGVEVLGHGNQCFSDGMHPSGFPLRWTTGLDAIHRDDLSVMDEIQMMQVIDYAAHLIDADRTNYGNHVVPVRPQKAAAARAAQPNAIPVFAPCDGDTPIEDVIAALAVIPNNGKDRAFWWKLGAAVFAATNGSIEGYEAWCDWSLPHSHPGRNTCQDTWRKLHSSPTPQITAGTLFWLASQNDPAFSKPSTSTLLTPSIFQRGK